MYLHKFLSVLITLCLIACSGGSGSKSAPAPPAETYSIGGTISGLSGSLVVSNNSSDELSIDTNGAFVFPDELSAQDTYLVEIVSQPENQQCEITGEQGTVSGSDISSIQIDCFTTYRVGGTVIGLAGILHLTLNQTEDLAVTVDGAFFFLTRVPSQQQYLVGVSNQPEGQQCEVVSGSGVIEAQDIDTIAITCVDLFSLSGTITSAARIQVDSDVNDPHAAYANNGFFESAQQIINFVTLNGFASAEGSEFSGDRFATSYDELDVYSIQLQANQVVTLQVVDFNGIDSFQGDLDLYLYDTVGNLIDSSLSTGEFEQIVVPEEDVYFITVSAFSGISKYVLRFPPGIAANQTPATGSNFVPGESIIKFHPGSQIQSLVTQRALNGEAIRLNHEDTDRTNLARFRVDVPAVDPRALLTPSFQDQLAALNPVSYQKLRTLQMIKRLNTQDEVHYAEPNYLRQTARVPNDPNYGLQWHYPAINLPQAWELTTGTPDSGNVIVAVLDTGVYLDHPDLSEQLIAGYDFISSPQRSNDGDGIDPNPDDPGDNALLSTSSWHGTHVAGTIAARSNDGSGAAGVSWGARIMPVRVLGVGGGTSFDTIQGMRFAAGLPNDSGTLPANRADIINLSLGSNGSSQAEQEALNAVREAGVIVVAAAGNEASSIPFFPASYQGVISVSATNVDGNRAPYSNFGTAIDIAAPGGDMRFDANQDGYPDGVLSTLVDDQSGNREPALAFYEGTSMASPHVAGTVALMKALYPELTPDDLDTLLQAGEMTFSSGQVGRSDTLGYGIVDASKSVQAAHRLANGGTLPTIPAIITVTPAAIILLSNQNSLELTLANEGDEAASIESISAAASWLTIGPALVDGNGLGTYLLSVDRTGLTDILYTTAMTVTISNGSETIVPVSMLVSDGSSHGNSSAVYVILMDAEQSVLRSLLAQPIAGGQFTYEFTDVPGGRYFLAGGSDVDNDFFLCQNGETCGGFPVLGYFEEITLVDEDLAGLDFVIDILFSSQPANTVSGDGSNVKIDSGLPKRGRLLPATE
jgi:serine protease